MGLLACVAVAGSARADEAIPEAVTIEPDEAPLPPCLDPELRPQKKGRFEFSPYGGSLLGANMQKTFVAGARAYGHIDNMFAVGVKYAYSRLFSSGLDRLGGAGVNPNVHIIDAEVLISTDIAMRWGTTAVVLDLFGTLGVGALNLNDRWDPMGVVGGGIRVHVGVSWLAPRVDLECYLHPTRRPSGTVFDVDVALIAGLSIMLPP
jgi:hypothetical protein